jgi:two-component system CheB/CheR fusion protein
MSQTALPVCTPANTRGFFSYKTIGLRLTLFQIHKRQCDVKNASTVNAQGRFGVAVVGHSPSAGTENATMLSSADSAFPVVGIGASAGGLEALEQFFRQAPADSGLAFVVVQHLDPTHESRLVQLLQCTSLMPVAQVVDGQAVLPNHIYVIAPGRDMVLLHGVLHLMEPTEERGLRLPIDHFLRSLAADLRGNAIGVILSGMGSDGTLGLRAIKENAGAAFVQALDSARFDAMPRSAIDAGVADVVAPAEELVSRILAFLHHAPNMALAAPDRGQGHGYVHGQSHGQNDANEATGGAGGDIAKVLLLLRERTGHDFSHYRKSTVVRRIERRMALHQLHRITDYLRLLRESKAEAALLFQELLIGVTSFFRDPAVWDQIKSDVMPALLAMRPEGGVLRAWVPGCSTGEEAYGLAMLFKEALEAAPPRASLKLQIFATDLDKTAIEKARSGIYPLGIAADVSAQRLRRFFIEEGQGRGYRVSPELREMVVFAPQNVAMDPPFNRLDLLSCRNLLIYLEPDLQQKLIALFHHSLNPGGMLLLGSAETVGPACELFALWPGEARLYRRLDGPAREHLGSFNFPTAFARGRPPPGSHGSHGSHGHEPARAAAPPQLPSLKQLADDLLLQRFAPAAVLVTAQGEIVYVSGKTGRFLEPAAGKANLNLLAMAREGLGHALAEGLHRAMRDKQAVTLKDITVPFNQGRLRLNVHVQPLDSATSPQALALVAFEELSLTDLSQERPDEQAPPARPATRLVALQNELQHAREDLQTLREDMQASQEELKSTNEELQSTNEELQSTNEELTTSKEEMQSMNEELRTVNHELASRVDQVVHTVDDMDNLINSTQVATLFLDAHLGVRRFTPATARLIKLIPSDLGRPITDLVSALVYPELADDAHEVLSTLVASVRDVPASDGRWYAAHVMPYRTQDNRIDGVVVTFSDIALAKALESTLHDAQELLARCAADGSSEPVAMRQLATLLRHASELVNKRLADQQRAFVRAGAGLRADMAGSPT